MIAEADKLTPDEYVAWRKGGMRPGLREHKGASLRVGLAEFLPEEMCERTREILSLASTNPRKGHATTLMWTVCNEADSANIVLLLQPKQFGDGLLDDEKLERFYGKFGFQVTQREPCVLMARAPDTLRRVVQ